MTASRRSTYERSRIRPAGDDGIGSGSTLGPEPAIDEWGHMRSKKQKRAVEKASSKLKELEKSLSSPAWPADQDREGADKGEESGGSLAEGSKGAEEIGLASQGAGREAESEAGRGIGCTGTGAGCCADGRDGFGSTGDRANDRRSRHGAGRDVERRPVTGRGSRPRTDRNVEQDESATPRRAVLSFAADGMRSARTPGGGADPPRRDIGGQSSIFLSCATGRRTSPWSSSAPVWPARVSGKARHSATCGQARLGARPSPVSPGRQRSGRKGPGRQPQPAPAGLGSKPRAFPGAGHERNPTTALRSADLSPDPCAGGQPGRHSLSRHTCGSATSSLQSRLMGGIASATDSTRRERAFRARFHLIR